MVPENTPCSSPAASSCENRVEKTPLTVAVLLGPTAVGKSATAMRIAADQGWEIVSCDSRQIYRGMDIGTAKPSPAERSAVPHRLIDIIDPSEEYSAYRFAIDAAAIIKERANAGKKCIVCGGTGLYFHALASGLTPIEASDAGVRDELTELGNRSGSRALHQQLIEADPVSAQRIHENDLQRIVRALAVYRQTAKPMSAAPQRADTPATGLRFVVAKLSMEREELYKRIDSRVDAMVEAGLVEEFRALYARFGFSAPGMQSVGYRELLGVETGAITTEEAIELIKRNSRRYAKRQITWFSHKTAGRTFDSTVEWREILRYYLSEGMER